MKDLKKPRNGPAFVRQAQPRREETELVSDVACSLESDQEAEGGTRPVKGGKQLYSIAEEPDDHSPSPARIAKERHAPVLSSLELSNLHTGVRQDQEGQTQTKETSDMRTNEVRQPIRERRSP